MWAAVMQHGQVGNDLVQHGLLGQPLCRLSGAHCWLF